MGVFSAVVVRAVLALLVSAAVAPAMAAPPVKLKVDVTDPGDRVVDATVRVSRFGEFNDLRVAPFPGGRFAAFSTKSQDAWVPVTPDDGVRTHGTATEIKTDRDGKPLQPGFYKISVSATDNSGNTIIGQRIVYVGPGASPSINFSTSRLRGIFGAQLTADSAYTRHAIETKDKATYDAARASGAARVEEEAQDIRELDAEIKAFRTDRGIPEFKNANAVRRAIKAARNTKGLPVNQDRIEALELYEDLLRYRAFMDAVYKEALKLFKAIPDWPAEKKEKPAARTSSYLPEPGTGSDDLASSNISIRGGFNFGGANVSAKGDLETTTTSGNISGSNGLANPFLGLQMTVMLHSLAIETAGFGALTPIVQFYAAQNLGGFSKIFSADIHPGAGADSSVSFRRGFQAGLALGFAKALTESALCGFGSGNGCMDVTLWAGPLIATMATRVITDERGGGGQYNSFTRNDTMLGAMLGMQVSYLACTACRLPMYLTLGGQLNFTGRPDSAGGRTSPFNFDYDGRVRAYTEAMFWVGVAFQLDQVFRAIGAPRE